MCVCVWCWKSIFIYGCFLPDPSSPYMDRFRRCWTWQSTVNLWDKIRWSAVKCTRWSLSENIGLGMNLIVGRCSVWSSSEMYKNSGKRYLRKELYSTQTFITNSIIIKTPWNFITSKSSCSNWCLLRVDKSVFRYLFSSGWLAGPGPSGAGAKLGTSKIQWRWLQLWKPAKRSWHESWRSGSTLWQQQDSGDDKEIREKREGTGGRKPLSVQTLGFPRDLKTKLEIVSIFDEWVGRVISRSVSRGWTFFMLDF